MLKKFDSRFFALKQPLPFICIVIFMFFFAFVAYRKKHLSSGGSAAAFVAGVIVLYCLHIQGFILLCVFYMSSNLIGKYRLSKQSAAKEVPEKKNHVRDCFQVLANGLCAVIAALYFSYTGSFASLVMFGAAVAEANSDTWAGEIGRLSSKPPVSIRTFRIVPKGLSGGVTPLGFAGAFTGSVLIAFIWVLLFETEHVFLGFTVITLTGFAGCLFDSFLGATFQALYLDEQGALTEQDKDKDGKARTLVRGIRWMDNDAVNLVSNVFASVFALGLVRFI